MNGVVHECDRLLRLARQGSPQVDLGHDVKPKVVQEKDESDPLTLSIMAGAVVDTPAFYNIFGQALVHLWRDSFERYLLTFEAILLKHAVAKPTRDSEALASPAASSILAAARVKRALETHMSLTLALAIERFERALELASDETQLSVSSLPGFKDASSDDLELIMLCSTSESIKAELMRASLMSLLFPLESSTSSTASQMGHSCQQLDARFQEAIESGAIICPSTSMKEPQIAEMLQQEVQFVLEILGDLSLYSRHWNHLLVLHSLSATDIKALEDCPADTEADATSFIHPSEEQEGQAGPALMDLPDKVADIDGSLAYYALCTSLISSLD